MAMLVLLDQKRQSSAQNALALDLSFEGTSLPSACTFSRASTGTSFSASGLLTTSAINIPRFDYGYNASSGLWEPLGLMVEASFTNYALKDGLENGTHSNVTITSNFGLDPMGGTTTKKFADNTATSYHRSTVGTSLSQGSGANYIFSCFARYGTLPALQIYGYNYQYNNAYANFDLINGVIGDSSGAVYHKMTNVGNGIYLCSAAFTCTSSSGANPWIVEAITTPSAPRVQSYTGTGQYCEVWGLTMGLAASDSSFIVTDTTPVTRAADQLSFSIPSNVSTIRYTFDDNSTQDISVCAGNYTVDPTGLNRSHIKRIHSL